MKTMWEQMSLLLTAFPLTSQSSDNSSNNNNNNNKYISTFNPHNSLTVCTQLSTFYKCRNKVAQRGQVTWPSHTSPPPSERFVRSENLVISHSFLNLSMTSYCLEDKSWFLRMTRAPSWSGLWVPLQSSLYMMLCLDHMWFLNTPVCWVGQLCLTLWPHGLQPATLLSMEFSRQEYWNELLFPTSGDLPDPGIEPISLASLLLVGRFFYHCTTWEALVFWTSDTILCLSE